MNIKTLPLNLLNPAKYNPRRISSKARTGLMNSIESFGLVQPIICNSRNFIRDGYYIIVSGHQRLDIIQAKGYTETECVLVDLDDRKEKKLNVLMNSQSISGVFDPTMLDVMLEEFMEDEDYTSFNFDELESRAFIDKQRTEEDDVDLSLPDEPVTKFGDVYDLGPHRLICGDSTDKEDVGKLMNNKLADMIFTDPPYSVDYHSSAGNSYSEGKFKGEKIFNDNLSEMQAREFYAKVAQNIYDFSKPEATFYWWFALNKYPWNSEPLIEKGWHVSQTIIWVKNSFVMSWGQLYHRTYEPCLVGWKVGQTKKVYKQPKLNNLKDVFNLDYEDFHQMLDMWYERRDNVNNYQHPTQKPINLAGRAIKRSSRRGEIVLDLFGGSGSTLVACDQLGRVSNNMELDPKFCDVIVRRLAKLVQSTEKDYKLTKNGDLINLEQYQI